MAPQVKVERTPVQQTGGGHGHPEKDFYV